MNASTAMLSERSSCAIATRTIREILDVLAGQRPLQHIRDRLSGPVAGLLSTRHARSPSEIPDYRLRSVHACLTTPSKVEACAVIGTTSRSRALVLRLEQRDTTWVCSMLSLL